MKKFFAVIVLLLLAVSAWAVGQSYSQQGFAMNTLISMSADKNIIHEAYALLYELDNQLSMYNSSSDLAKVNSLAGKEKYHAPEDVINAVREAVNVHELTGGVFNPLIGAVTNLWKINRNDGKIPTQQELQEALSLTDTGILELGKDYIYLRKKGAVLDLGGLAKGYASDRLAQFFRDNGATSALIDLGGNVYTVGHKQDGSDWRIGVRNPLNPQGVAVILSVHDTAVITSGNYERYKVIDGKRYSHFFDPSTGESVNSSLLSVTVITPNGALADGLATAFMIMGQERAKTVLEKIPDVGAIFITNDTITATSNLKDIVLRADNISYF